MTIINIQIIYIPIINIQIIYIPIINILNNIAEFHDASRHFKEKENNQAFKLLIRLCKICMYGMLIFLAHKEILRSLITC